MIKEELAMSAFLASSNEAVENAEGWWFGWGSETRAEIERSLVFEQGGKMG